MGSKRLPGKVLLPLNGRTVIEEVIARCKLIPGVDEVVCAIPDTRENNGLDYVIGHDVRVIRGSEHDVLSRYVVAARETHANNIIRITADCPLICPELCGEVLKALKRSEADYACNIEPRTFPQGMDCEAFTCIALDDAAKHGRDEHVTTWMRASPSVKRVNVRNPWVIEGRLTLDTEDDYRVICAYFGHKPYESAVSVRAA